MQKLLVLCLVIAAKAQEEEEDYDEAEDRGAYVDYSRRNANAVGAGRSSAPTSNGNAAISEDHFARQHPGFLKVAPGETGSFCHRGDYRALPLPLQNEHQCMLLEAIQRDVYGRRLEQSDRHRDVINLLNKISSTVDQLKKNAAHTVSNPCILSGQLGKQPPITANNVASTRSATYNSNQSNFATFKDVPVKSNCYQTMRSGITQNGVYPIIVGTKVVLVQCDMTTDGGGWTVIQRRTDGTISFNRKWPDYSRGFGNSNSEYWLGNELIHQMTTEDDYELRVDISDWAGASANASYASFRTGDAANLYALHLGNYTGGNAGDALGAHHRNAAFSTSDSDNDRDRAKNCAALEESGWWFGACSYANLNGPYVKGGRVALGAGGVESRGILWEAWKRDFGESMKTARMLVRPNAARRALYEGKRV